MKEMHDMREHNPNDSLGHRFRMLHNAIDKCFSKDWERMGYTLTHVQCATLHFIHMEQLRGNEVFQKDVEAFFSISGATASNIISGLEKMGLIQRFPLQRDARKKQLALTKEGLAADERGHQNILRMEDCMARGLTEEEKQKLKTCLDRIITNIEELYDSKG